MLKLREVPGGKPSGKTGLRVVKPLSNSIARITLATLLAGYALLTATLAQATTEALDPSQVSGSADTPVATDTFASDKKVLVSPYVKASRQRVQAQKGEHVPSMAIIVGQPTRQSRRH